MIFSHCADVLMTVTEESPAMSPLIAVHATTRVREDSVTTLTTDPSVLVPTVWLENTVTRP